MSYLFTSESVSEGHPDKVADQISDAILDYYLLHEPDAKVACETLVTRGLVLISGEVRSNKSLNVQDIARQVIKKIGYTKTEYEFDAESCGIITTLHKQSDDIHQGVDSDKKTDRQQGAGDQGMMFGYASNETENYMPLSLDLAHLILLELADIRQNHIELMPYLRPDAKSQVTIEYTDDHQPQCIDTIVISTQHDRFIDADSKEEADLKMHTKISHDIQTILMPRVQGKVSKRIQSLFTDKIKFHINPTGVFVNGGPAADTGLTGRKIIVDTYGGKGAHGGGAFSGKDPSKVDRSAAYAARHIAKNMVAAGIANQVLVQVAYAIGVADPVGLFIDTYHSAKVNMTDGEIADKIKQMFDLKPASIISNLKLKNPIYSATAAYGHMGRNPETKTLSFLNNGQEITREVELFTWEKLDRVDDLKKAFSL